MFCASEAATAICRSSEHQTATIHLGSAGRAIDRHNPIIHNSRRSTSSTDDAQSHLPKKQNLRRNSFSSSTSERKGSAGLVDAVRKSSCIKPTAYFTPSSTASRRYLISQNHYSEEDKQPRFEKALVPAETAKNDDVVVARPTELVKLKKIDAPLFVVPPHSSDKYLSPFRVDSEQVVVVRVSLHCKGCASKVKKHISRIQGVTSFNIDLDAKKVIVVGEVTPSEVLASISKVRTAQVLPPEKPNPPTSKKAIG